MNYNPPPNIGECLLWSIPAVQPILNDTLSLWPVPEYEGPGSDNSGRSVLLQHGMIATRWGAYQAQCDLSFPQTKTAILKQMAAASSRN
jgi:hypothetical protein